MVPNLQCDVCGRKIVGEPKRVIIEGAKMTTCNECAKLGSGFWEPKPPMAEHILERKAKPAGGKAAGVQRKGGSGALAATSEEIEVVEGFGLLIKQVRERMGLTPEDLGKRIGEKESVIKKIESERIVPDIRLAAKLEHALKIKLLTRTVEPKLEKTASIEKHGKGFTLGELVHLRGAKRRNLEDEGDNSLP